MYDDEITDLREQFNKHETTIEGLNKKVEDLEKVKEENQSTINKLEEEAKNSNNGSELEEKLKEQTDKASALEAKIKQMETDSAALTKRNQDLIGDKNKKISELNADIVALKA